MALPTFRSLRLRLAEKYYVYAENRGMPKTQPL